MPRLALVIGGASGLGKASAHAAAEAGMTVAVADLAEAAAIAVARELPGEGHVGCAVDIADEQSVRTLFTAVESACGPVAVLQNFAGIMLWPRDGGRPSIVDSAVEDWDRTFAVNARGAFLCVREMLGRRAALPVPHGRIVLISSSGAQLGGYNGHCAYIASKGAILSLVKVAAREAAPLGITVNAIAPGAVDTPMLRSVMPQAADSAYRERVPMGRIGSPADIAAAAAFLSSEVASYITGACIDVNGGIRMQ
jgi:NAD(P)-dependent dehydrogenase (short-subunit alcohol dehydrogenase family)